MDHYSDKHHAVLHSMYADGILPEFTKTAELLTSDEKSALPDQAFADPIRRMYPIHTAADTLVSAAYLVKTANVKSESRALKALATAAYGHGVETQFLTVVRKAKSLEKTAQVNSPDAYGLLLKHGSQTVGRYYMPDAEHVKVAQDHFVENHNKYPLTWRREISKQLVKKAKAYGVSKLHPVVTAYSGDNVCYSVKAAEHIASRVLAVKDDLETSQALFKLAKVIVGRMNTPVMLEKIASILDLIDRTAGLDRYYNKRFHDPYKTIFNMTKEAAEEAVTIVDILGDQYTLSELAQVDPSVYEKALGQDFTEAIMDATHKVDPGKLKDILPTLPRDEKAMLKKHLKNALPKDESDDTDSDF